MRIYNTLARRVEEFEPISPPKVGMYTCGPTVYDFQHIGNFRTMVLSDLLHRVLEFDGYRVKTVRNVTDIDDKIIKNAGLRNQPISEFTKEYTDNFFKDLELLNVLPVDEVTFATSYVLKMIEYVKTLVEKGFAYVEKDGSVFFDISKFPVYGRLSRVEVDKLKTGTRTLSDEYTKETVQDFALWKAVGSQEREGYDSPWGRGRPGWHIECSVMSQDQLGESFDLHVGGRDLIFPHHENEIAQSEAKTGKPFVKYWIHGEFLLVDGQKMSKSLKNFYTLRDIVEREFDPLALRYFYLSGHYRTILNFTWEGLTGAQNSLVRLRRKIGALRRGLQGLTLQRAVGCAGYEQEFSERVNDDLNFPEALAVLWKLVDDESMPAKARLVSLQKFDQVLGLKLNEVMDREIKKEDLTVKIKALVEQRESLRAEKKFSEADEVRGRIENEGFALEDSPEGPKIFKR